MPSLADRAMNAVPNVILRSPFHGMMSKRYAILEFTGRKSGRRYRTPIAYVRNGNRITLSSKAPWAANLAGGAPVALRLRGNAVTGMARPVTDPGEATVILRQLVDAIPGYAGRGGIATTTEGMVSDEEIRRVLAAERGCIEIELDRT